MVQSPLCKRSAILHFIVQTRPKSQRGINVGEARFELLLFFLIQAVQYCEGAVPDVV